MIRPVPHAAGRLPVSAPGTVDAAALALYLSRPSLALGVYPAAPWKDSAPPDGNGRAALHPQGAAGSGAADPREMRERLEKAVRRAIGAHRTVAVLHDGGLGASALLVAADAAGRAAGAEVTVVVADHPDPHGASAAVPTQQFMALLGGRHRFLLAEDDRLPGWGGHHTPLDAGPIPGDAWNPVAPDLGRTSLVRAAEARAAQLGATVLLTPDGCDELLQAGPPPLPTGPAGWAAARRQVADRWRAEGVAATLADAIAVLGRGPAARRARARLHVALAPFAAAMGKAPGALAPALRPHVEAWTADWIRGLVECLAADSDPVRAYVLARMMRFSGPLPAEVAAAAPVPRTAPFLDPEFTAWALRLPAAARYDARLPTPELRRHGLIVSLVPRAARDALRTAPPLPQLPDAGEFALCRELGLLAGDGVPVEAAALERLAVLERWLAGVARVSGPRRSGG
ncbi:hypothetical protein [Nonomuraea sp. SYSU D8015]|uniref:hypothetical protein n=1 Tax=Nonomuraea sp. SYSU D8015 TaxID=2593644 RepID=UPI001660719C|nr:hypothetical protein [Nonomuraea sp. SYSU D8015]